MQSNKTLRHVFKLKKKLQEIINNTNNFKFNYAFNLFSGITVAVLQQQKALQAIKEPGLHIK